MGLLDRRTLSLIYIQWNMKGFLHVEEVRSGRDLRGADLSHTALREAKLWLTDLTGANLIMADLSKAHLSKAHLIGVRLMGARLVGAHLDGAHLIRAKLNEAKLSGADLIGADLRWADLGEADLEDAKMVRVQINDRTKLLGADIRQANFSGDPVLKRDMEDLQWLQGWKEKWWCNRYIGYPVWRVFCNCGRSFSLWAVWSVAFAL